MTATTTSFSEKRDNALHDFAACFLPGAAQGFTSVALGHPLDTLKTRLQTARVGFGSETSSSFRLCVTVIQTEGVTALYRGVTPILLIQAAKRSMSFALWDKLRTPAQQDHQDVHHHEHSFDGIRWTAVHALRSNSFFTGAVAGCAASFIGCPMHVLKIQTQNQAHWETRNALTCAIQIYKRDGVFGFYRGLSFHLAKDASFAGCYLGCYPHVRTYMEKNLFSKQTSPPFVTFAAASLSSAIAWVLLFPLDTVKTRAQGPWRSQSLLDSGIRQLYRGLPSALVRSVVVSGTAMTVYEFTKGLFASSDRAPST